jgi:16S rRNA (guanine527-N7)-methyltransferase
MPAPAADEYARTVFGPRLALAEQYADRLVTDGVAHGHIGPGEVARIWPRHLVNGALLTDLVPAGARVVDVGSGAGLPGLPMAIRRPDLYVILLEPRERRVRFLESVVRDLELESAVRVLRGRAEEDPVRTELAGSRWMVARAVAPLDRLVKWCLPILGPGGKLLAVKGSAADEEVRAVAQQATKLGISGLTTRRVGGGEAAVTVVEVERSALSARARRAGRS